MKIIRFLNEKNEMLFGCDYSDGTASLLNGDVFSGLSKTGERVLVKRLLTPITPTNIICLGLNYHSHAQEVGMEVPRYPTLFMKNLGSVLNPGDPIRIPNCCSKKPEVDFEAELAVVIGKSTKNATVENALDHVAGYTVANDVSARRWQGLKGGSQWVRGKSFDTFCPFGPSLVTPDEIRDPQQLNLVCRLNGDIMQQVNTSDMIFSVAETIAFVSEDTTLPAGTFILTGPPAGVGFTRNPPVFLKSGDTLEIEIDQIGTLINPVEGPG